MQTDGEDLMPLRHGMTSSAGTSFSAQCDWADTGRRTRSSPAGEVDGEIVPTVTNVTMRLRDARLDDEHGAG